MSRSCLYLAPSLLGPPGGIARYGRMVCRGLCQAGAGLRVLALADTAAGSAAASLFPGMAYQPCRGSRPEFGGRALLSTAQQRLALILVGHANFAPLGWLLSRLAGVPFVTFIYGIDVWEPLPPARRWALGRSAQIISISRFTARQAVQANGISMAKVRILHNCLDPGFEGPTSPRRANSALSLLTVARMSLAEQYKGHDYVIRAMPALLARFPHLVYHIVGDGDGRPALEALAAQVGVAHAVRFHGSVSEEALRRHYAEASLFIMPSRGEGFGFVFLEAMAHGVPAIGGNVDATPEVIADGETGYLVDPTSVEAIVAATSRLLAHEELRQRMGQAAMRHARQNFSFLQFQQRLLTYLSEPQATRPLKV